MTVAATTIRENVKHAFCRVWVYGIAIDLAEYIRLMLTDLVTTRAQFSTLISRVRRFFRWSI